MATSMAVSASSKSRVDRVVVALKVGLVILR